MQFYFRRKNNVNKRGAGGDHHGISWIRKDHADAEYFKQEKRKIALIVNDMGSINIDASILNKTGNRVKQVEMVETDNTRVFLKTVVSVVDVDRIYREFLHGLSAEEDAEEGDVINLIMDQIEFCNLMILNKTDLLTREQLREVKE